MYVCRAGHQAVPSGHVMLDRIWRTRGRNKWLVCLTGFNRKQNIYEGRIKFYSWGLQYFFPCLTATQQPDCFQDIFLRCFSQTVAKRLSIIIDINCNNRFSYGQYFEPKSLHKYFPFHHFETHSLSLKLRFFKKYR